MSAAFWLAVGIVVGIYMSEGVYDKLITKGHAIYVEDREYRCKTANSPGSYEVEE